MVASLQYGARCPCGYCHISDVEFQKQEDHMESFFLAETVRILKLNILWLLAMFARVLLSIDILSEYVFPMLIWSLG